MNKEFIISKPETISEVSRDVARVFFAAMVVGQLLSNDKSWFVVLSGLFLSFGFWYIGVLLAKR